MDISSDLFILKIAQSQKELNCESSALNHCVRTYGDKVSRGETVIYFIRRKDEPDKPFYTLEIKPDGTFVQCRGEYNCSMTEEVKDFTEKVVKEFNMYDKEESEGSSMSNIVEADYRVVQERTLPVIASEILFIESQVARTALEGAIQIGLKLKEAKEQVEHGQWENWCHENLNYSKSKTEKLMRIASEYGDENSIYAKTYTCTDLSISKALSLLQVPEEEVKNFSENNDVESMTVKELNDKIKALESEKEMRAVEVNVLTEEYEKRLTAADEELEHIKNELTELQDSTADPDALADLEAKLEKAKEKEKKLKEEMKQEKESRDLQIQQAVEEKADQMRKEAEQAAAGKTQRSRKPQHRTGRKTGSSREEAGKQDRRVTAAVQTQERSAAGSIQRMPAGGR